VLETLERPRFPTNIYVSLRSFLHSPLALLLLASLVIRIVVVFVVGTPTPEHENIVSHDDVRYDILAWHLAQGKGYINSFGIAEAKDPPLLPIALAPVYVLFGHSYQAARIFLIALVCVSVAALYWLTMELFDRRAAVATGILAAVYPDLVSYSGLTLTESLYIPTLALALVGFAKGVKTGHSLPFVLSGLLFGCASLTRPEAIAVPVILALAVAIFVAQPFPRRVRNSVLIVGASFVVICPWTIRNAVQLHAFLPVSAGSGIAFYVGSYLPWSGLDIRGGESIYAQPFFQNLFRGRSTVDADQYLMHVAIEQIKQHPLGYIRLIPRKLYYLFRSTDSNGIYAGHGKLLLIKAGIEALYIVILTLIVCGIVRALWRPHPLVLLYLVVPGYLTLIHVLTIPAARYAFPIVSLLLPFGGLTLAYVRQRLRGSTRQSGAAPTRTFETPAHVSRR